MPSPVTIFGVVGGPPKDPSRLGVLVAQGGSGGASGGAGGGLTPNPIRAGVNIAFGSKFSDAAPLWQLLEELGPT